jgi:hypothetical protein
MSFETVMRIKKLRSGVAFIGRQAVPTCLLVLTLAAAPTTAGTLGLDVDLDVSVGGGGVGVGANVGVGGTDVSASVGVGGGTGGTGSPGGPGVPGAPGVGNPNKSVVASGNSGANGMVCAKDGNETAYNGYVVRDRVGTMIGWVHEATVSPSGKVLMVRMQSTGMSCYKLANAGFRVSGGEVWANVDATAFR